MIDGRSESSAAAVVAVADAVVIPRDVVGSFIRVIIVSAGHRVPAAAAAAAAAIIVVDVVASRMVLLASCGSDRGGRAGGKVRVLSGSRGQLDVPGR